MSVWDAGPTHAFVPDPWWRAEFDIEQDDAAALTGAQAHTRKEPFMKIRVHGIPAPQGSKRPVRLGHGDTSRIGMVESSKKVGPWRDAVRAETQRAYHMGEVEFPSAGRTGDPVMVVITFILPRPQSHFGTGRNAGIVRPSAPPYPHVRPDLDKLVRSTLDGLKSGGAYNDDSQVVSLHAIKAYPSAGPNLEAPGAHIEITGMGGPGHG